MAPHLKHKYEMHFDISQKTLHLLYSIGSTNYSPKESTKSQHCSFQPSPCTQLLCAHKSKTLLSNLPEVTISENDYFYPGGRSVSEWYLSIRNS